jgi:hypothetical protein
MPTTGAFLEIDEKKSISSSYIVIFISHPHIRLGLYTVRPLNSQLAGNMKFETRKYLVTLSLPKPKRKPN